MRQRAIILVVALFLGLTAAFLVRNYANEAKQVAFEQTKTIDVLVAAAPAPAGMTLKTLRARKLVETKKIPKEFVVSGALTPAKKLGDQVLAAKLTAGEQLTAGRFKTPTAAGLAFAMPKDKVAVAIPINSMKAAGNLVKIGDNVNVVGTAQAEDGKVLTKTILQNVKILAINTAMENEGESGAPAASGRASGVASGSDSSRGRTVTVALSQADSEKLIYMQEEGRIWLTLLPSKKVEPVSTDGQTIGTVFK